MPATPGDRQTAISLVLRQLQPFGDRLIDRDAIENLRTAIVHSPAFGLPMRVGLCVLEELFEMAPGAEPQALHDLTQKFRRDLEADEVSALELVDMCLDRAIASEAETARIQAPWGSTILAFVLAAIAACAHAPERRACREECSELRGPTWSLWGGPTLPPAAWEDCVDRCGERAH